MAKKPQVRPATTDETARIIDALTTAPTPGMAAVIRDRIALRDPLLCREGFHRGVWRVPEIVEGQIREQMR